MFANILINQARSSQLLSPASPHQRAAEPPTPSPPSRSACCQEVAKESEERSPGVRVEEVREEEGDGVQPQQQGVSERLAGGLPRVGFLVG